MSTTSLAVRTAFVATVTASLCLGATPASAVATPFLAPAVGIPTTAQYNAVPHCNVGVGVATSLYSIRYVVDGFATSYSTNGTAAVATGISCWIKDLVTGNTYGPVAQALPGPYAVAAGTIDVPIDSTPFLCGEANALFSNNEPATGTTVGC